MEHYEKNSACSNWTVFVLSLKIQSNVFCLRILYRSCYSWQKQMRHKNDLYLQYRYAFTLKW